MATLTISSDFVRVRNEQMTSAQDLFGRDPEASAIVLGGAAKVRPYTPPDYARLVYADWGATFHTAVAREASSAGLDLIPQHLLNVAKQQNRLPNDEEMNIIRSTSSMPLTVSMRNALIRADSASRGPTRTSPARVQVLTPSACAQFWDAIGEYGINCGATRAVVTSGERWNAFFDGLSDATDNLADGIGRAAAKAARTAGEAIGAGASGFFSELGVVETVLLFGAGFVALKVL